MRKEVEEDVVHADEHSRADKEEPLKKEQKREAVDHDTTSTEKVRICIYNGLTQSLGY